MIDDRARALLEALNELFMVDWTVVPGAVTYAYALVLVVPGREPFAYTRYIQPKHINAEPFRTALQFADEVCERYGRYLLLRPEATEDL